MAGDVIQTGFLMPIGGAENKTSHGVILQRFVELSGGLKAHIVVLPAASALMDTGARYCDIFAQFGIASSDCLDIESRGQANDPACVELLHRATGIFLTGGDQVKLLSLLGGTLTAQIIHQRFAAGATIAGTSAGASALSQSMIAFGRSGSVPSQRMVQLVPGLGLIDSITIDQHFRQRDRMGRLMTAVAFNPANIGVGIDEDTAFIIGPDAQCEVLGSGGVTIVDGSELEYSDIHLAQRHGPIATVGMCVHTLTHGYWYDLNNRSVRRPDLRVYQPAVSTAVDA